MSEAKQDGAMTAESIPINTTTTLGLEDQEMDSTLLEVRVLNIAIIAVALFVLTVTGLYCIVVCYNRSRQSKRAHVYESAVTRGESLDPVAVKAVKRSTSFMNPLAFFRKPEAAKESSRIYYIYSNPLPVGLKEEEEEARTKASEEQTALTLPLSFQDYANDPKSGIVLDPPIFYMQL
ncbi:uncharacterized protein V6R79_023949 [Siganus canaliculatus]